MLTVSQDRADRRNARREQMAKANRWDRRQARREVLDGIVGRVLVNGSW